MARCLCPKCTPMKPEPPPKSARKPRTTWVTEADLRARYGRGRGADALKPILKFI